MGPGTVKVGPEVRDPGHLFYMGPKTRKVRPGTLMIGETRDPKQTSLVKPETQELLFK